MSEYVFVYNDGNGKFTFQPSGEDGEEPSSTNATKKNRTDSPQRPTLAQARSVSSNGLCTHGRHDLTKQTLKQVPRTCSGCSRKDLPAAVKCSSCSFALCDPCSRANFSTARSSRENAFDVEQKVDEEAGHHHQRHQHGPSFAPVRSLSPAILHTGGHFETNKSLFPVGQTIEFHLVVSGKSKDFGERLSLFVNSKLGSKQNEVEHVTVKPDLGRAWVVLRTMEALQQFKVRSGREKVFDLLDGWKVGWGEYVAPTSRTVYQVVGFPSPSMAESLCSTVRRMIEDQLKMSASELDLVVASEGSVMVIFSHGEYDVDIPRSLFLSNGHELHLIPTPFKV